MLGKPSTSEAYMHALEHDHGRVTPLSMLLFVAELASSSSSGCSLCSCLVQPCCHDQLSGPAQKYNKKLSEPWFDERIL